MAQSSRISFEFSERIPLDTPLSDVDALQDVEIVPDIELTLEGHVYRIRGFLTFHATYEHSAPADIVPHVLDEQAIPKKKGTGKIYYRIPVDITLPPDRVDSDGIDFDIRDVRFELMTPTRLLLSLTIEMSGIVSESPYQPLVEQSEMLIETTRYWKHPYEQNGLASPFVYEEALEKRSAIASTVSTDSTQNAESSPAQPKETFLQEDIQEEAEDSMDHDEAQNENLDEVIEEGHDEAHDEEHDREMDHEPITSMDTDENERIEHEENDAEVRHKDEESTLSDDVRPSIITDESKQTVNDIHMVKSDPAYTDQITDHLDKNTSVEAIPSKRTRLVIGRDTHSEQEKETSHVVDVLDDQESSIIGRIFGLLEERHTSLVWHFVQEDETLEQIATRYGLSTEALRRANTLQSGDIRPGMRLKIPQRLPQMRS
ncbi:MAG: LysM peptidoglycan-binding domain-containing protein [Candidatus Carbobacillus sp.]|nr:LysM peptidoglycan-binding domain-containing protein [Candidatus Carbobacillus sp.]